MLDWGWRVTQSHVCRRPEVHLTWNFCRATRCPWGTQLVFPEASIPREGKVEAATSFMT